MIKSTTRPGDDFTAPYHFVLHRAEHKPSEWVTHLKNEQDGGLYTGHYFREIGDAVKDLARRAAAEGLQIDWANSFFEFKQIMVTNDHKHGIDSHVFYTDADFSAYCKQQLDDYYEDGWDDPDSEIKVSTYMEQGQLDKAWAMAIEDDGSKELHRTTFGYHSVDESIVKVPFTALPFWVIQCVASFATP